MHKLNLFSVVLAVTTLSTLHAQDDWHMVKSESGAVEAMLPGPAKRKLDKRKTLAGTITTKIMEFQTDDVEFSVSSTKLSRFVRRFADDDKLYKNAKNGVLGKFYGQETSFKNIRIGQIPARELQYEVVDFQDESHKGYHGVAVFAVLDNTIYSANAIIKKESGNADLKKFRESIRIKKR